MLRLEPLNADELEFIERQYRSESKIYMRGMNVMLIIAALAPLAVCILLLFLNRAEENTKQTMFELYFLGFAFMLFFVGFIAFVAYRMKVRGYYKDTKGKKKVVELANIQQKKYMKLNNTYHFYLDSKVMYTIEVGPQDFEKWRLGDEISVEYAEHSKEYFGYY